MTTEDRMLRDLIVGKLMLFQGFSDFDDDDSIVMSHHPAKEEVEKMTKFANEIVVFVNDHVKFKVIQWKHS